MYKIYGRSLMFDALSKAVKSSKLKGEELDEMEKRVESNIDKGTFDHEFKASGGNLKGKSGCLNI